MYNVDLLLSQAGQQLKKQKSFPRIQEILDLQQKDLEQAAEATASRHGFWF